MNKTRIVDNIELIDNPSLKTRLQAMTEWTFTSFFWIFWIYLLLPLLNLLLWLFVGYTLYEKLISGYADFFLLLRHIGLIALAIFIGLRLWGYYNYHVFGKRNRRRHVHQADPNQMAEHFGITIDKLEALQKAEIIKVSIRDPHDILEIQIEGH
ncbi:MAG: poly-beta-1,6-N-acetyl-D-glucosamine biosynthesis protein PgaD [Deltaproteobacteria bacterium]|nr:poly-beta-1,6-N-acetyl-D-glucosamine biosynthesis protein PgaD [Deltaproteobacteria bacterium]MBW1718041.1 poly-beta-1,6-N-acetyl-D-glucosamine biosynthesis protein PgaD [Deltaproteobacteria bacterium]MBW1931774.1 poly-beta-1,6-N-acetyl-D-glucosamine biosynthesis protein PgaD [Deltaproteobacteria bacterium]MBW1937227.1 poly-beta-1,6-N-acetyl-D-glucosamine biosynthesis protein PgaD [Deltaproteobacteria bacterium]MBW1963842.1 poly-beta-1,6-N-acetyl-D-glucosamine biosynthesis protein PgaD [Delt